MYNKVVLDNRLTIITSPMPHSRSVSIAILVGTGSCYENQAEAGISHFAEHLYFKGTERRPTAKEITQDIEGVGGLINASTDKELTIFWCKVASSHFDIALDVLHDLLLHSRFDSKEMEQERKVIIEEINMNLDIPQQRVNMLIDELIWPEQPLGREVAGDKDSVSSITREQLLNYIARRYLPGNAVVSVAGNIEHDGATAQIEALFNEWTDRELATGYMTDDKQTAARLRVEPRDSEQAHLCLAVRGFSYSHPKRYAIDVLNTVLGGGMSSRLFIEIREHRGLAYDIHSYTDHFLSSGSLTVSAGVDPDKLQTAVSAILDELSKLKQGITPDELNRAKELLKGRLQLRLEDSQNTTLWLGSQEILRRQIITVDEVISIIDAVSADELVALAGELLRAEQLSLAVVGPVKEEEALRQSLII
jgi:predicted Zn-dependent peptidase